ncbi:MAG: acyltransferase family protein [Spirochaetes bacterium]|nr:acyltransferase family protein [Spirochaetota bacterium]
MENSRLPYIDNLRALVIIIVVMVHTAVTYSGIGSWYYIENRISDSVSGIFFGSFGAIAQSFDMSFFFMLAGYFIPLSFDKKGTGRFIKDRLFRLGVPLLIYMIIIHPVAVKLAHPDLDIIDYTLTGFSTMDILGRTGPLWFVQTLLIFTFAYVLFRIIKKKSFSLTSFRINTGNILLLTLIIAIPAFLIRIVMPVGNEIFNLQLPYFSGYIVMFIAGIYAGRLGLFERIDYRTGKKWMIIAFTTGYIFFLLLLVFGGPLKGEMNIFGGFKWQSFAYALWESFSCVAISAGLIGIFKHHFNRQNRFQKFLSENYFGVFVFHAPVLIAISVSLKWLAVHPVIKFFLVALCAVAAAYVFTYLVRKIWFIRRIFS